MKYGDRVERMVGMAPHWGIRLRDGERLLGSLRRGTNFQGPSGRKGRVVDHSEGGCLVGFKAQDRTFTTGTGEVVTIRGGKERLTVSNNMVVTGSWA